MHKELQSKIDKLKQLNLSIRKQLKEAELRIPEINAQIRALTALGSHDQVAIEGDIVTTLAYLPNLGPSDSCQIYQAVLVASEGIGVAIIDLEDFLERQRNPDSDIALSARFQAFDDCSSFVKAALLPHVDPLLERLLHILGQRQSPEH
jgi:hypothetical protein